MKLSSILKRSSSIHPQSSFITTENQSVTYNESWMKVLLYRQWLKANITSSNSNSIGHTNTVLAFLSNNTPELFLSVIASTDLNVEKDMYKSVETVLLNVRWSAKEISNALAIPKEDLQNSESDHGVSENSQYRTVLLYSEDTSRLAHDTCNMLQLESNHKHIASCVLIPGLNDITGFMFQLDDEIDTNICESRTNYNDDCLILFTSGTTSEPKGVRLSHLSLLIQAMAKTGSPCNYDSRTRILANTVPFFHVGGLSSAVAVMLAGGTLRFFGTGPFRPSTVIQSMNDQMVLSSIDVNTLVLVPTMLHGLLTDIQSQEGHKIFTNVRLLLIGGQSISQTQLTNSIKIFPNARIVQTYACTEAGSSITFAVIHDPHQSNHKMKSMMYEKNVGSEAGYAPHHIDVQIFALDESGRPTRRPVRQGVGAIGTRGPHVMNGYWRRGNEFYNASFHKNWIIMNDLGYINEKTGSLYFCGRANDVIRSGGETVFAPEVENIINQHPEIEHCAVFALHDEKFGEIVCAAIVPSGNKRDNMKLKLSEKWLHSLKVFCHSKHLAAYKKPKLVFTCDELPRNSSGKVLKHVLQQTCRIVRDNHVQSHLQCRL